MSSREHLARREMLPAGDFLRGLKNFIVDVQDSPHCDATCLMGNSHSAPDIVWPSAQDC